MVEVESSKSKAVGSERTEGERACGARTRVLLTAPGRPGRAARTLYNKHFLARPCIYARISLSLTFIDALGGEGECAPVSTHPQAQVLLHNTLQNTRERETDYLGK